VLRQGINLISDILASFEITEYDNLGLFIPAAPDFWPIYVASM
jgi:hypothetical protein